MPDTKEKLVELLDKQKGYTLPIWTAPQTIEIMVDALIANGVTIQLWISVEEKLPEDCTEVLVWARSYVNIGWIDSGVWKSDFVNDYEGDVTHWMPLPPAPKGE